jgi:hypothetical protein
MPDNDFLNSLFAAETETAVEPPISGALESAKQPSPDNFLDGLFDAELSALEIQEQVKPKTAKEVLSERIKAISERVKKYTKIKEDYIYGDEVLREVKQNTEQYESDKVNLASSRPKLKAKIKGLESSSARLDEKITNLEVEIQQKAQDEVNAKLASVSPEQQKMLIESGKVQEFVDKLVQNYKDTMNPAAVKLQKFKDGVSKVSEKLVETDKNLKTNTELRDNLKDNLRNSNGLVEKKASEKIENSLAKLKEKSARLTAAYLESPEGKMDTAIDLAIKNSDRPNIEEIKALVGEEGYEPVIEALIDAKIDKSLEGIANNSYNEGYEHYNKFQQNMIQLAKMKGVDTNKRSFRDGEYDSYDEDFDIAQSMVKEQLARTPDIVNKIKDETSAKYKALWKVD